MLKKWMNLQLFAEGGAEGAVGAGGVASGAGEEAAAAGQKRLRELGVPESRIRNRASLAVGRTMEPGMQAAAAENEDNGKKDGKPSFKELLAENPEYNEQVQAIIRARLRDSRDAQEKLDKLAPALEMLARQHKLDPENLDYDALAAAIGGEKPDPQAQVQERYRRHFARLEQQGEALKAVFPDFDLARELRNPAFARMTHPAVGISLEDAYYAVHRSEIQAAAMQVTAQTTARKLSNAIASGMVRPAEAGQAAQAPSVAAFDYRSASREQREALKQRIRQAAARGEKVYPGYPASR